MLVKEIVEPKEGYQCEKCGNAYSTLEEARQCESNPISPFKYEINDMVQFEFPLLYVPPIAGQFKRRVFILRGIVRTRRVRGLPEADQLIHRFYRFPTHANVYLIRIIDKERGLIVLQTEDKILRKIRLVKA
ncbi:MAG: hypothetical protein ACE5J6_03050 [Candidatus Bathyarchaeia archaeon]